MFALLVASAVLAVSPAAALAEPRPSRHCVSASGRGEVVSRAGSAKVTYVTTVAARICVSFVPVVVDAPSGDVSGLSLRLDRPLAVSRSFRAVSVAAEFKMGHSGKTPMVDGKSLYAPSAVHVLRAARYEWDAWTGKFHEEARPLDRFFHDTDPFAKLSSELATAGFSCDTRRGVCSPRQRSASLRMVVRDVPDVIALSEVSAGWRGLFEVGVVPGFVDLEGNRLGQGSPGLTSLFERSNFAFLAWDSGLLCAAECSSRLSGVQGLRSVHKSSTRRGGMPVGADAIAEFYAGEVLRLPRQLLVFLPAVNPEA